MKCRHCGNNLSFTCLDLGSAPPSNAYLNEPDLLGPEIWLPLKVLVCECCWLVQTEDYVGHDLLFTKDYAYFSSYSSSWVEHAKRYVEEMIQRFSLNSQSLVIEIAANDGYLLQFVKGAGIPCYGVEPTASTAIAARIKGIEIIEKFFGTKTAEELLGNSIKADLMVANNVLAHVPDINDFVAGFSLMLSNKGVATFEFPHLLKLIQESQFDTIYHEHYSYLSLTAVSRIFLENGLEIFDVQKLNTHGGSLRVFAQIKGSKNHRSSPSVTQLLDLEASAGIGSISLYQDLQSKAEKIKDSLLTFLIDAKRKGLKVCGYGAAAKGNTLINFAGIRPDLLPYVVDKSPAKRDKYMPGSRIPIVGEDYLRSHRPDLVIILPWNLRKEIVTQLSYARDWNVKFVTFIPSLSITN